MKRIALLMLSAMVVTIVLSSCETGFSKKTYISSLEKFVTKVEENWKEYDEKEWEKADARMEAFEEKYDKYADDFTKDEAKKVLKLMTKYSTIRLKARVKSGWEELTGAYETGKGVVEGVMEGVKDIEETLGSYADSLDAMFNE